MTSSISRPHPRAFTLVELLVAATLSILLLGMMFAFLVPTMRASVRGSSRVEMQQQAVVALSRMAEDLEATAPAGIAIYAPDAMPANAADLPQLGANWTPLLMVKDPVDMSIVRLNNVNASGQQVWDTHAVIYNWQSIKDPTLPGYPGILFRKVWDGKNPLAIGGEVLDGSKPVRLSDQSLDQLSNITFPNNSNEQQQTMASGVNFFSAAGVPSTLYPPQFPPPIVISQPITLTLSLQRRTSKGGQVVPESFQFTRTVSMRNQI